MRPKLSTANVTTTPSLQRLRSPALIVSLLLLFGACSGSIEVRTGPSAATPSPSPEPKPRRLGSPTYDVAAAIPRHPAKLAADLRTTTRDLYDAIERWRASGTGPGPDERAVQLRAMRQQRIYRVLSGNRRLYAQVRKLLPRRLQALSDNTVRAANELTTLVTPLDEPPDWKIYKPAPAKELLRYYRKGQRRFDIPWQVLASLNFVESRFGRILGPSSAGAMGPMQFMPATWAAYGNGGDINDSHDSILGAARYLAASGAPERMKDALWAYNHSDNYVRAISIYARQMMKHDRAFYAYYHWQVYVRTKAGDVQLSGPGADR
ncbi:MAG TPA: lytic transglycosylase domain-containing protein [Actinomycetota bacterium]|nr:lytic transglycosylase domain-containing protein [Actinomycetota bacterium]